MTQVCGQQDIPDIIIAMGFVMFIILIVTLLAGIYFSQLMTTAFRYAISGDNHLRFSAVFAADT